MIAPEGGGLTDVVILASNRAAGIVGFSPMSRSAVVGTGSNITLVVQRQWSALGVVQVSWTITGGGNDTGQFTAVSGTALFAEVKICHFCIRSHPFELGHTSLFKSHLLYLKLHPLHLSFSPVSVPLTEVPPPFSY